MATVAAIRAQIQRIENIKVTIEGDGKSLPGWDWGKETSGSWTFKKWKDEKFNKLYPDLSVKNAANRPENTTLSTLRQQA